MKQLLIEHMPFKVDKLLVEQSIKENRPLRVSGIIQRAGVKTIMAESMSKKFLKEKLKNILMVPLGKKEL